MAAIEKLNKIFQQASEILKMQITSLSAPSRSSPLVIEAHYQNYQKKTSENTSAYEEKQNDKTSSYLFDGLLQQWYYDEGVDQRISNLKMSGVSSRRKDELFKKHKKEQEEKINQRRMELEELHKFQFEIFKGKGEFLLKNRAKTQIFTFKNEDLEKLRPDTDLNDTILDNYLKIMQFKILPPETEQKTFIFSSFFMAKLLGDILKEDPPTEKEMEQLQDKLERRIVQNYANLKRWTRKTDLFEKQYLVIPINAYKHWNCMIVVSPNSLLNQDSEMCKIFYLDSYFQKRSLFTASIKAYMRLELAERKQIMKESLQFIPSYQLLVPRQTNTHDCGLYTLCYIEYLLFNHTILDRNMEIIQNRELLRLFPRSIIFTMRQFLRRLFFGLLQEEEKDESIKRYVELRKEIESSSVDIDYDEINQRQFQKYYRINSHLREEKKRTEAETEYFCKIKFYLDCEINHYEKDKL